MKDGFYITIETIHVANDKGLQENVSASLPSPIPCLLKDHSKGTTKSFILKLLLIRTGLLMIFMVCVKFIISLIRAFH